MRCGYCKKPDVTIEHVRNKECDTSGASKFGDSGLQPVTGPPEWPASDAQILYVLGLQKERILPANWVEWDEPMLRLMEKDEVSAQITMLKSFTHKDRNAGASASRPSYTMPGGRYAIYEPGVDDTPGAYSYVDRQDKVPPSFGRWKFYQVDKPAKGRWEGYTFIKMLVGSPGDYQKVDMPPALRASVLQAIEADPKKAMEDYGKQSGVCGKCHSPLTDPVSLQRGIGPKCYAKLGW